MEETQQSAGTYLLVLPVPGYRVGPGQFAIESAFAEHLKLLREKLGPLGRDMVVVSPSMTDEVYATAASHLAVVDEAQAGIRYWDPFRTDIGRVEYLRRWPGIMRGVYKEVRQASVVHSGISTLYRPFEFPSLLMARALGKKTISVTDIDARNSARMNYKTGRWSLKEFLVTRLLHDPYASLQHRVAARLFSLVMLKGRKLADDFGHGRPNVKNFLDSAFSANHMIAPERLEAKLRRLADPAQPVVLTFFGRLVAYKGIDHMLRAIRLAVRQGAGPLRFEIIGDGPEMAPLRRLADELEISQHVVFHGAVPFGDGLFQRLYDYHLLLAAPLSEDTPRSALDAMASGQALLAYDSYYYREMAEASGAVDLVPWMDSEGMGRAIAALVSDRPRLTAMIRRGVEFARDNTQELWLDRRMEWTRTMFERGSGPSP